MKDVRITSSSGSRRPLLAVHRLEVRIIVRPCLSLSDVMLHAVPRVLARQVEEFESERRIVKAKAVADGREEAERGVV